MSIKYWIYVFVFFAVFPVAHFSYAQTTATSTDLQVLVKQLQAQVEALQKQVTALQAELGKEPEKATSGGLPAQTGETPAPISVSEATPPELTRSLFRGSSGDDVRKLQEFLAKDKEIYPEGLLTGFFGPLTEAAVKKWQGKHGIESVGIVGPRTITKLQDMGRGVIQGLLQQGAGASGVIPPGLLTAPGIQKKFSTSTPEIPPILSTPTLFGGTTTLTATTTPSGTIPATPATPAEPPPATGSVPAAPATPAVPAQPVITTVATTAVTQWVQAIAPSGLVIDKGTTLHLNPPSVNYSARFDYALTSDTKYIRVYLKRPNSSNFVPYTHEAQLPLLDPSQWNYTSLSLQRTGASSWYWWPADEFLPNADPSRFGEYKIYVTVINTAGAESVSSETKSIRIYAPPVISSPIGGSTVSTKPTITFVTGDSSVGSQYYAAYLYKANGTVAWSNGLASANFVYPGTELNPSENPHRLLVHSYAAAPNFPQWYSPFSQVTFSVSTSPPAADTTPPSVPINLCACFGTNPVSSTQIDLSWSASTDNVGVTGYKVFRNGVQIDSPLTPSKSDTNLSPSTIYTYTVAAVDGAGNVSAQSAVVTVTTPAVADTTPPSISSFGGTNFTSTSVTIYWTTSESADSQVEYGLTTSYGSVTLLDSNLVTSHSVPLSGLQVNTTYYYRIKTKDAAGNLGTKTDWITTNPAATDTTPPSVPTNLTATEVPSPLSSPKINLSWSASTDNVGVTGYYLYREGASYLVPATTLSYSDYNSGLVRGITYNYTVSARDAAGNVSAQSSPVSVTTATTTASIDPRAKNLAAISQALNAIREQLLKLLQ